MQLEASAASRQFSYHISDGLTYIDSLGTGGPGPARATRPTVVTREVAVALAGLVEEAYWPLLTVISPIMDVLWTMGS